MKDTVVPFKAAWLRDARASDLQGRYQHIAGIIYMAYQTLMSDEGEFHADVDIARRVGRVLKEIHRDMEKINEDQYNYNLEYNSGNAETFAKCGSKSEISGMGRQTLSKCGGSNSQTDGSQRTDIDPKQRNTIQACIQGFTAC